MSLPPKGAFGSVGRHVWLSQQGSCCQHPVGRGPGCKGQHPMTKNYLVQNVNGAGVEKPCPRDGEKNEEASFADVNWGEDQCNRRDKLWGCLFLHLFIISIQPTSTKYITSFTKKQNKNETKQKNPGIHPWTQQCIKKLHNWKNRQSSLALTLKKVWKTAPRNKLHQWLLWSGFYWDPHPLPSYPFLYQGSVQLQHHCWLLGFPK